MERYSGTELASGPSDRAFQAGDWLKDDIARRYFQALEYKAYYESIRRAAPRRDIAEQLLSDLLPLFQRLNDQAAHRQISSLITGTSGSEAGTGTGDVASQAEQLNPRGCQLLELKAPFTLQRLKSAYLRAVKIHHPDRGGKTADMQAVNDAYSQFHELACKATYDGYLDDSQTGAFGWGDGLRPPSPPAFFAGVGVLLISVATDIMAVDTAYSLYRQMAESPAIRRGLARLHIGLLEDLSVTLKAAKMDQESEHMFELLTEACQDAVRQGLNYSLYAGHVLERIKAKKVRIVINHQVQADHAYRLGMISEKRYSARTKKLQERLAETTRLAEIIRRFAKDHGFIKVPRQEVEASKAGSDTLVPEPRYCDVRFEQLTAAQQEEYAGVFTDDPDYKKVQTYLRIRVNAYTVEIVKNWDSAAMNSILVECETLKRAFPDETPGYDVPRKMVSYLEALKDSERKQRLTILSALDHVERREANVIFSIVFGMLPSNPIEATEEYLAFMQLPYQQIVQFEKTGSAETPEEKVEKAQRVEIWNRDSAMIKELEDSDVGRISWGTIMKLQEKKPDEIAEALLPYLKAALDLGKTLDPRHTGQLQLGYTINKLTAAFVKQKNWAEARYWLELFFDLPENYRDRTNRTEETTLRRRLERCKKNLV